MTTWNETTVGSVTYSLTADVNNGYVAAGYIQDGYFDGESIWVQVPSTDTTWIPQ